MVETNLRKLLDQKAYADVYEILSVKKPLSFDEHKMLAISIAYTKKQSDALSYLVKEEIECVDSQFEIYFLNADYKACEKLLKKITKPFLALDYYLALNDYENALATIKGLDPCPRWYYELARIYGHQSKYDLAIRFLEKSAEGFQKENNQFAYLQSIANWGNYLNLNNQIDEAGFLFEKLSRELNKNRSKIPNFLLARLSMNLGHFLLERGKFFPALMSLSRAHKKLEVNSNANEYTRACLLLANCLLEMGHYQRVISVLNFVKPKKAYQILDRNRYIAIALMRMGQFSEAKIYMDEVKKHYTEALDFHLDYAPIDFIELEFLSGSSEKAKEKLKKHLAKLQEKNQVAMWYCLNRWNWLTAGTEGLSQSLAYHHTKNLKIEWNRDKLLSLAQSIGNQQEHRIEFILSKLKKSSALSVEQTIELQLLNCFQEKVGPSPQLEKLVLKSPSIFIKMKYLALDLSIHASASYELNRTLWTELNSKLGKEKLKLMLSSYLELLGIKIRVAENSKNNLDLFLDQKEKQIYVNGEMVLDGEKKPKLFELLSYLCNRNKATKEDICQKLFARSYNPETDNNNIYVSLNRLNKLLGSKKCIQFENGLCQVDFSTIRIRS